MAKRQLYRGQVEITIDDSLSKQLSAFGDRLGSTVLSLAAPKAMEIAADARAKWPVATGTSRKGLEAAANFGKDYVRIVIRGRAPYTMFIVHKYSISKDKTFKERYAKMSAKQKAAFEVYRERQVRDYGKAKEQDLERKKAGKPWLSYVSIPFTNARKTFIYEIEEGFRKAMGIPGAPPPKLRLIVLPKAGPESIVSISDDVGVA